MKSLWLHLFLISPSGAKSLIWTLCKWRGDILLADAEPGVIVMVGSSGHCSVPNWEEGWLVARPSVAMWGVPGGFSQKPQCKRFSESSAGARAPSGLSSSRSEHQAGAWPVSTMLLTDVENQGLMGFPGTWWYLSYFSSEKCLWWGNVGSLVRVLSSPLYTVKRHSHFTYLVLSFALYYVLDLDIVRMYWYVGYVWRFKLLHFSPWLIVFCTMYDVMYDVWCHAWCMMSCMMYDVMYDVWCHAWCMMSCMM